MASGNLPLPAHYNRGEAEQVWKIKYEDLAHEAEEWAKSEKMIAAISDRPQICLLLVDCQNTFCTPGFELFVAGRSGNAAVEDSIRITEFIYRNLSAISNISLSMDTHYPIQIFHSIFLIDKEGNHPDPMTAISKKDIEQGKWRVDPKIAGKLSGCDYNDLQAYLRHYCGQLEQSGKYRLMVWPYHSMLGGIGHALVSLIEEAVFFHSIARSSQPHFEIKGSNMLTENYSIFRPEVDEDQAGNLVARPNMKFFDHIFKFDRVIIAGQAKSHCVAWTVQDLHEEIKWRDPDFVHKIYLLKDCTSPVVVPGAVDFTDQADHAFREFARWGMHIVKSTDALIEWPGMSEM